MMTIAAAQGEVSMQARYIRNQEYTMLMSQREQYGYQLRQFTNGDGGAMGAQHQPVATRDTGRC
jgi:hypothetical protein